MPKKPIPSRPAVPSRSTPAPAAKSVARNTPVPRPQMSPARPITHEMIAKRAFEIYASGKGGSQLDNWFRAERELKSGQ
ncbi:MAG: DUF2934 domain-containing protein [Tepidisphaeraceae bacterium]